MYEANIIQDGDDAHYLTKRETFKVDRQKVKSDDTIRVKLAPGGGACITIRAVK